MKQNKPVQDKKDHVSAANNLTSFYNKMTILD